MVDREKIARILAEAPRLSIDTEGEGLDWRIHKTCGYVVTWGERPDETTYLPFGHKGGGNLDWDPRPMFRSVLAPRRDVHLIFFNASFDLKFLTADGVDFDTRIEDAQINAYLLDEWQKGGFSLDATCRELGVQTKKGDALYAAMAEKFGGAADRKTQMENFHKMPGDDPMVVDYAAGDGTSTWQAWAKQQPLLDREAEFDHKNLRYIWDIETRLIPILHRMVMRGVRVNEAQLRRVNKMVDERLVRLEAKLPKDINVKSPKQMEAYFRSHGITDWPHTPGRVGKDGIRVPQPSFPETWLLRSEPGRRVVDVRKIRHLKNSFLTPMLERHLYKGRVHCTFNQTLGEDFGTVTSRLSCNNPNLQQVHKRNKMLGSVFRSIFEPDRGMEWGSRDYSQCEPRLLAHYGNVATLIQGYLADPPVDAHTSVAKSAHIDRESGKRLNQALLTGAGYGKLQEMLADIPGIDPVEVMTAYFNSMPEIKPFQKNASTMWRTRPLRSLLGRLIRLDDSRGDYKAVNRLLQTGNADIIKKAMVDCDDYLRSEGNTTHMLLNIHDALEFQYPKKDRKAYEHTQVLMTQDYGPEPGRRTKLRVPMVVDSHEGPNWAVATYTKPVVDKMFEEFQK